MTSRQLILLSPYRFPAQQPLTLAGPDMAAWLSGYSALWHPLALRDAASAPRVESPHTHETPRAGHVYALPMPSSKLLGANWEEKARTECATTFHAVAERNATLDNLKQALRSTATEALANCDEAAIAPFFGIGLGYLLLSALSEAMEHENLLDPGEFWKDVQNAIASISNPATQAEARGHLEAAARKLLVAREALYPVPIHLLDLVLLEEQDLDNPWPITVTAGEPINVIATAATLEKLKNKNPEALAALAQAMWSGQAEVCGGDYLERTDALLPVESQLWNLRKGVTTTRQLLGFDVRVYARRRFGAHPNLPSWLNQHGIQRAVLLPGADGGLPAYSCPVMNWSTQDGQDVNCFMRRPLATDKAESFFNLGHFLFKTTREDHTATLAFLHGAGAALPWYGDLMELSRLACVAGQWTIFTHYFDAATGGEYAGALTADDFQFDYLTERIAGAGATDAGYKSNVPISGFVQHLSLRRRLDSCFTLAALQRGLAGAADPLQIEKQLGELEDTLETGAGEAPSSKALATLTELETYFAAKLADRLLARANDKQPGYLLLNPCGFTRRVALELENRGSPMPIVDPVKAVQVHGDKLLVVAETPALGFAWLPQAGPHGTSSPTQRMRLADERCVRNEYFEAEIDHATGGLRAIRDHKTLVNRLSQRLIFRPGSDMKATRVTTTSVGPALGEIVSEGQVLGPQQQVLASFRQRFRAWLGRPVLELRLEIYPEQPPAGDPWHAYYAAQFAWRDERVLLFRGVNGAGHVSTVSRPQTPDYLEIRQPHQCTSIFPCGLPFHQREGGRMLDVILVTPGEPARTFDIAIGLDREHPMQTALGLATPASLVPTYKGPPHVGPKGWLFHLDSPNLLLTSMRPLSPSTPENTSPRDGIVARLLECNSISTPATLRCPRDPRRVTVLDGLGKTVMDATHSGDSAIFHVGPGGLVQVCVEFSV